MRPYIAHILSNLRLTTRERTVLFFNYAFPLGFYFLFAGLNKAKETGTIAAVLTSVLTIGLLGNGFFGGGLRAVMERENGILRRFKVAPPGPLPILVSAMVVGVLQYLPVVFIMLGISVFYYGMAWPQNFLSFIAFIVIANLAFRALGSIIASVANSMAESNIIIQCFYFPMMFLSGATFPISFLPDWVQVLSQFLPATHLVSGLQGILIQKESLAGNWKAAGALLLTAAACTFIALKIFRWEKTEKLPASAKLWVLAVLAPFLVMGAWNVASRENITRAKVQERALRQGQATLIQHARIFTAAGEVIERGAVLVRDGKIAEIYRGEAPTAKSLNAIEVEAAGKTLLPGLIDLHIHIGAPGGVYEDAKKYADGKLPERRLQSYLYSGITTVKSTGDWIDSVLTLRDKQRRSEILASELYAVGPLFTAEGGHPTQMLEFMPGNMKESGKAQFVRLPKTPEEAQRMVRDLRERGVDGIKGVLESGFEDKPMKRMDVKILAAVCAEARAQRLPCVVHTSNAKDIADALEAGADGVEHGSVWEPIPDDLLRRMAEKKLYYDPTLAVFEGVRMLRDGDFKRLEDSLLQQAVPLDLMQSTKKVFSSAEARKGFAPYPVNLPGAMTNLKRAAAAGLPIVTGTDAGNPMVFHGPTVQMEAELWVKAGIAAQDVLIAATRTAAALLGQERRIGTIEIGKQANLLLVDGNPLEDIGALRRISLVMLHGERVGRVGLLEEEE
jgi:imidazolonepropionase-like amidohydrolase/ABC-type multidrug transport system permease subunit